jgi:hypothetical protein
MAAKYILDPSGNVKKIVEKTLEFTELTFNGNVGENIASVSTDAGGQETYATSDFNVEPGSSPFSQNDQSGDESVISYRLNSNSFGFVNPDNLPNDKVSFKPMYHFSDTSNDGEPRLFAKEFEMLTGYVFDDNKAPNSNFLLSSTLFLAEYFAEMIAILATLEAITSMNELISDNTSVDTRLVEKYNLRLGKYSITEFDIFSKYVFDVLNYPKDHSNFLKRITAFFIGTSEWLSPDAAIDINKIIEESNRVSDGTKTRENLLDQIGIQNQYFGLGGFVASLANIAIAAVDSAFTALTSSSGEKRLYLLMKKFKQEALWKSELFAKKKNEELEFFVSMDYYYTRFAIERMHVGLKLLNRYAYEKTYLNPKEPQSPLNRVSGNRGVNTLNQNIEPEAAGIAYSWNSTISDKPGEFPGAKPGMTTRLRALPSLLNLSYNFRLYLTESGEIQIPASISQNFYVNTKKDRHKRRLPKEVVKKIEDHLESEYVPFYIHDVRTNEILSFHAFIESISDSFNPEYSSASGFGRIDDVKSYIKTTRNINLSFTIAATSEEDHDFMWYQINKLVTLVYPQWSEGYAANTSKNEKKFTYPFTQVPTASPLVRIRLGDVLKSNYSRSSLSRIFGIYESVDDSHAMHEPAGGGYSDEVYQLTAGYYAVEPSESSFGIPTQVGVKDKSYVKIDEPVKVNIVDDSDKHGSSIVVEIEEGLQFTEGQRGIPSSLKDKRLLVSKSKLIKLNSAKKNIKILDSKPSLRTPIMKPFKTVDKKEDSLTSNNPITASYESGMSRGIAGFITQLDMNYGDSNWETTRIGSKAPMLVKVTINFAPIHDIVPGIDHNGMMRAPAYNVGRVNNAFFGDPHDENTKNGGIENALKIMRELENSRYKKG